MSRNSAIREGWLPQTKLDRDAVMLELREVLTSPHFCNSKRYPALLEYIVEKTLAGQSDLLKERTLGVEVFDRPASYDTNADTVVRYTAGEVRKRLSLYYHELERTPPIQISLPSGSYVPEFLHSPEEADQAATGSLTHAVALHGAAVSQHSVVPGQPPGSGWEGRVVVAHAETELGLASGRATARRRWSRVAALLLGVALLSVAGWKYRAAHTRMALDEFWVPVRDQAQVTMCVGGSVFAQNNFSGVATAGKDIDYPFVSMQSASAIAELSGLLARSGSPQPICSPRRQPR